MNRINKSHFLRINGSLVLSLLLVISSVQKISAQVLDRDHNEQVTIVGSYDPTINQAYKINLKPEITTYNLEKPEFTYETLEVQQETKIEAGDVTPATIRADKKVKLYDNYLRAGFGSLLTPFVDFHHSSGKRNDHRFNANLHHISTFSDIPDYAPSNFSNTDLGVSYDKYTKNAIVNFGLGYGLDTYRYYGFKPTDFPEINTDSDTLKQSFNQIRLNVGARSNNKKDDALVYKVDLSAYYYFDKWKTNQTDVQLGYDFGKPLKAGKKSNYQKVGIEGLFRFGVNADSIQSNTDLILTGIPYYRAKFGMVAFSAGVNLSYLMADSTNNFDIYPVIDVKVNVIEDMLSIYAGVDGGLVKNSYYDMTQVNPWVNSLIPITWQNNKMRAYAGVRGNISGQFGFNLEIGWLSFDNMPFYINATSSDLIWPVLTPAVKFDAAFDNGSVFTVSGELTYKLGDALNLWLRGSYDMYSLDSLAQPYHKPISMISLGGSYNIKKKVNIWLEMFSYGKRYAFDITGASPGEVELDGFFDLNLGVEYFATEKLTVFVTGTNLLGSNYERFLNYPVQGLQVMAGVGFRF